MKVLFVGLGQMGERMAQRLDAEQTMVWNRSPKRLEGYQHASSIEAGVQWADVVIMMLTDHRAVHAVLQQGIWPNMVPGKVIVDMSTGDPDAAVDFEKQTNQLGGAFVAAPVAGSLVPAKRGELTVLAGGDPSAIAQVRSVLGHFGQVIEFSKVTEALGMKLVLNTQLGYAMDAVGEALRAAEQAGLDRERVLDVLAHSAVVSPAVVGKLSRWQQDTYHPADFSIQLMGKDLEIMRQWAQRKGLTVPGIERITELYQRAVDKGYGNEDISGVGQFLADASDGPS